jgi:DNA (cytosine-5)-methyltransferase 1
MLRVLDLFSGVGGFSLGLERTRFFQTAAFCEADHKARQVLAKHWPNVPCFHDVSTLTADQLRKENIHVDVITGGFPCQDISTAGKGAGLDEIRPQWVIVENVSALRSNGLGTILRGLAEIGYDAEWHCVPASAIGAPHQRDRIWIIAYPNKLGTQVPPQGEQPAKQVLGGEGEAWRTPAGTWWSVEPCVGRVADGVPGRVDRLKQLGNAIVPQMAEIIGHHIARAS